MKIEEYKKNYRGFEVFPFVGNGIVKRLNGSQEWIDSNGYRVIRGRSGDKHMVSHIIYAVGIAFPRNYPRSFQSMKNYIVKYRDGNKLNCNFSNLECVMKRKFKKKLEINKKIGSMF